MRCFTRDLTTGHFYTIQYVIQITHLMGKKLEGMNEYKFL